jgi:alanine racemase
LKFNWNSHNEYLEMGMSDTHLTWVEIDARALRNNIQRFRKLVGPDVLLTAVVKANAYGHGQAEISTLALQAGADWLAVESPQEGQFLREKGLPCPILLLGNVQPADLQNVVQSDFRLTVFNVETLERLAEVTARLHRDVRVHLKVETGMNRRGMLFEQLPRALSLIQDSEHIVLEGLCSHLATADEPDDPAHARFQMENFQKAITEAENRGIHPPIKHLTNSAGTALLREAHFDMVRVGISTYGLWPSDQTRRTCLEKAIGPQSLTPVLTWQTRVIQVKEIPAGSYVGYGRTFQAARPTKLAALPIGYSDGYDRKLSNTGQVIVRGRRAPVVGRVSMNVTMVDVTDIEGVRLGDEVVLLGRQGQQEVSADELARLLETINYEVVTRISWTLPRVVVGRDARERSGGSAID